jgi:hypothetical protein
MIFEAYLPVTNEGRTAAASLFYPAFKELKDEFGFVDTWPVYRQVEDTGTEISEEEFYRYQVEAADTYSNRQWLLHWRKNQEQRFLAPVWMIRYRLT